MNYVALFICLPWLQDRCGTVSNEVRLLPLSGALSFRNYCSPSAVMGPGWRMHFAALLAREVLLSLRAPLPFLRPPSVAASAFGLSLPSTASVRPSVCLSARPSVSPSLRRPPSRARAPRTKNPEKLSAAAATCNCVRSLARSAGKHDRVAGAHFSDQQLAHSGICSCWAVIWWWALSAKLKVSLSLSKFSRGMLLRDLICYEFAVGPPILPLLCRK